MISPASTLPVTTTPETMANITKPSISSIRRTDDNMRLAGAALTQILQHPCSNANTGGAQGCAKKHMLCMGRVRDQHPGHQKTQRKRNHHADEGDPQGVTAHRVQLGDTGIQPDMKQQEDDTVA